MVLETDEMPMLYLEPEKREPHQRTVLVLLDKSPQSHYAFLYALEHILNRKTDLIIFASVARNIRQTSTPFNQLRDDELEQFKPLLTELQEIERQNAHGLLRFHMNGTSELKYRCYSVILSGGTDPIGAVQRAIEENHIDLVVMNGTKDHSSSDMYTVSNYAKIIAKTAPCPVLLVKNQAQEQQQQQQ